MKDTFILYTEYAKHISLLNMEQRGILFTAIMSYQTGEELPEMDGATAMAFSFIKEQLDRDNAKYEETLKKRSDAGKQGGRPKANEREEKQEKAKKANAFSEKQMKANEIEEKQKKLIYEHEYDNDIYLSTVGLNAGARESVDDVSEDIADYLEFMRNHPEVHEDISNPSEILSIDFKVLSERIAESHFLQTRQSLSWLIGNYSKIVAGGYKDFPRSSAKDAPKGKGDLQLWQEIVRALQRAKGDVYCAAYGYNVPAYKMADEETKRVMAEIYKSLSREITEYFDPNSFLELCGMEEKDLKFERARFLKALPDIRAKITEG